MQPNANTIKGKWKEIKGEIQKAWGKLTDDEIEKTQGDFTAIHGLVQQKYGDTESRFREKLDEIVKRFEDHRDKAAEEVKDSLKH